MSSSLRNAVKRKTHKERAQPAGRKKLGLLEKNKDYKLRAADFARKKKHIESLKQKAELRNEDEFYFGMVNAETKGGVHVMKREGPDSTSLAQKLAERFDKAYLQAKLAHEKNILQRLQSSLHLVGVRDESSTSKLTVFVDDDEEADNFDETQYWETEPELAGVASHLLPSSENVEEGSIKVGKKTRRTDKAYAELLRRKQRVNALERAIEFCDFKQHMKQKGKRRKISEAAEDRPAPFVWSAERLR